MVDDEEQRLLGSLQLPMPVTEAVHMMESVLPKHPQAMIDIGKDANGQRVVRLWSRSSG